MKITFLGTSAGEEYPGIWCDCEHCAKARAMGGRNIRRNSALMVDGDVMIDIGKTAHVQAERFGLNIRGVTTLLVTHAHPDHFNTHTLWARQMTPGHDTLSRDERRTTTSPRFTPLPRLTLLGSAQVAKTLAAHIDYTAPQCDMDFIVAEPFNEYRLGGLDVYTLDGNHTDGDMHSINYIITRRNRTFLYLTDTGWPFDATLEALTRFKYDFIITEGTFGLGMDSPGHMRLDKNVRLLSFFNEHKLWKGEPRYYLTHIAPHWCPPHDEYAPIVAAQGLTLAYDGMTLEAPY